MSLGQPEQTKSKRTKNPKTKMKNKHKKQTANWVRLTTKTERKKKHALKYWYFLGEEKINLFVKGIPSNPFVVFPLELANTGSYSGYFFHWKNIRKWLIDKVKD